MSQKNPELTIAQYQENLTKRQRYYRPDQISPLVLVLGLPGEVGEVCEIIN